MIKVNIIYPVALLEHMDIEIEIKERVYDKFLIFMKTWNLSKEDPPTPEDFSHALEWMMDWINDNDEGALSFRKVQGVQGND